MSQETSRIASALEKIADEGINIHCHIHFPDEETDKFALDLVAIKLAEAIEGLQYPIGNIADKLDDMR